MCSELEIDIDIVGKLEVLNEEVQRILNLVSMGLSRTRGETKEFEGLPGIPFCLHPAWYEQIEPETAEEQLDRWLVACGFRELIESCSRFLEGMRSVLSALQLVASGDESRVAEWFEQQSRARHRFHKYGLPDKMKLLCGQLGVEHLSPLHQSLLSVNKVRNCLVHRKGLVSETHDGPGPLTMTWLAVRLEQYEPDGNIPVNSESDLPNGGVLLVSTSPRRREFAIGEMVSLNAREFNEVCFTAYAFGKMVVELAFTYADKVGIHADEESNREWRRRCPIGFSLRRPQITGPNKNTLVAVEWKEGSLQIE
jgi:hypothetical protein